MASTGTQTLGNDGVIRAVIEAGGSVIVDMNTWCSVFVSKEDTTQMAALGREETLPWAVANFYVPQDKGRTIRDLRKVLPHKPILTWE